MMKLKLLIFAHPAIHALASNYLTSSAVLNLFSLRTTYSLKIHGRYQRALEYVGYNYSYLLIQNKNVLI